MIHTASGIYCPQGDFYIDPWKKVDFAVITHAHADHARPGMKHYHCHPLTAALLKVRIHKGIRCSTALYGESVYRNGVRVRFFPAGHIAGSSQVEVMYKDEVWVCSGDYKTVAEPSCEAFEPVKCDVFISESTFGLPIFVWREENEIREELKRWYAENVEEGKHSCLFVYSLGKAQRIQYLLQETEIPVFVHPSISVLDAALRGAGHFVPESLGGPDKLKKFEKKAMYLAPSAAEKGRSFGKIGEYQTGTASGWMQVRGIKTRSSVDKGFVLSDHADWPGLLSAIEATGASKVFLTHGYSAELCRYLREQGKDAYVWETDFGKESDTL